MAKRCTTKCPKRGGEATKLVGGEVFPAAGSDSKV
jgi:hypothetical protein